jgi:hypothetical protein
MSGTRHRWALSVLFAMSVSPVVAADRYALLVTGASGGEEYALKYQSWRNTLTALLRGPFAYPDDHIIVLAEREDRGVRTATRDNVRAAVAELQRRAAPDDIVFILLTGHGTTGGEDDGKFNLVGPDLSASEWAALIAPIAGRVVFVDASSGSFPFLRTLAGRGRIVITATGSPMQEYETVFPEFFVKAFGDAAADADKNGKVSIWEAFVYGTSGVRKWFDERGQLPTERALLDDTGGGAGREADDPKGTDGAIAQVTFLRLDAPIAAPADSELGGLMRRRVDIQGHIDLLRARKPNLPEADYQSELERLLLELARLDRDIRDIRARQP